MARCASTNGGTGSRSGDGTGDPWPVDEATISCRGPSAVKWGARFLSIRGAIGVTFSVNDAPTNSAEPGEEASKQSPRLSEF